MYTDPSGEITWSQIGVITIYAAATAAVIGLTILTLGTGSAAVILTVSAIGFGSGAVTSVVTQLAFTGSVDIGQTFIDGFTGSMTACVSMLPIGAFGVATFGGLIGGTSYGFSSYYQGTEMTAEGMRMSIGLGFIAGLMSGGGYGYEKYTKFNYVSGRSRTFISAKKSLQYAGKANALYHDMSISAARFAGSLVFFEGVNYAYQNGVLRFD